METKLILTLQNNRVLVYLPPVFLSPYQMTYSSVSLYQGTLYFLSKVISFDYFFNLMNCLHRGVGDSFFFTLKVNVRYDVPASNSYRYQQAMIDMYTLLYLKQITNKDLLYSTGNTAQYCVIAYMEKEFEKEQIHMYIQLNHCAVHSKLIFILY